MLFLGALHGLTLGTRPVESRNVMEPHGSRIQNIPMAEISSIIPPGEPRDSIYLTHFQRSLTEVFQKRDDYRQLFSAEERKIADPFLDLDAPKALSRAARYETYVQYKVGGM